MWNSYFFPVAAVLELLRNEIALESSYAIIKSMKLRLPELQDEDEEAKALRAVGLPKDWEDVKGLFQYWRLPYIPEIIHAKLISSHHDNPLVRQFGIDKTRELIGQKYYLPSLRKDVENYVKGCNVCLTSKTICHKLIGNLKSLLIPTHQWMDLSIDFVIGLLLFVGWKSDSYDLTLIIVN